MTGISDIVKLVDALSKLKPEEMAEAVRSQVAPVVQILSGISHSLDNLNANIVKLNDTMSKRDDQDG